MTTDDDLLFADEEDEDDATAATGVGPNGAGAGWPLLIVDDDPDIHAMTRMVLRDFRFKGAPIQFLTAHSAAEAREVLQARPDIAVILLDVVMETDTAGLDLVHFIRTELNNSLVRIILRTGQPGQAPERSVILDYDINDYKAKSELTAQKLFTGIVVGIRNYLDLQRIEMNRHGLRRIIEATAQMFRYVSLEQFLSGVLLQLNAIFELGGDAILCVRHRSEDGTIVLPSRIVAATGRFDALAGQALEAVADTDVVERIQEALACGESRYAVDSHLIYFHSRKGRESVIYVNGGRPLEADDTTLIDLFCQNAGIGLYNVQMYEQVLRSEQATVTALARLAEYRDDDTGEHVFRVRRYAETIAEILAERGHYPDEIDGRFLASIGVASLLHDVGKVAVPDEILHKPGRLDEAQMEHMRQHTLVGQEILKGPAKLVDNKGFLALAVDIASMHHERWDGAGYPYGLKGEQIPLAARIVAVADVFDALSSERPYKPAWSVDDALALIVRERGKHFDPLVVDAFVEAMHRKGWGRVPAVA